MQITFEQRATATVVYIVGNVDGTTAEALMSALLAQVEGGSTCLVADLSGVEYTSSAGLRAILASVKQARQRGGDFRLAAVLPPVYRVLEISGFTSILKLYGDVDAAVASYVP